LKVNSTPSHEELFRELWVSLASLLRSYTAVHGLNCNRQAVTEYDDEKILIRHEDKLLALNRSGAIIHWESVNGSHGELELTETGRLRSNTSEEEMDLAAESWARELMQESNR
jgi:hypothetical protein